MIVEGQAEKPAKVAVKVRDYTELVQYLDARRRQLGMTMVDLDYKIGLQEGYAAKLTCGMKTLGRSACRSCLKPWASKSC
jgi:hypothetical protein